MNSIEFCGTRSGGNARDKDYIPNQELFEHVNWFVLDLAEETYFYRDDVR